MAPAKTMTGSRAQLLIADPTTGVAKVVGIFNNVSYGLAYDVQPVYTLGRYGPAESVYTSQEPINVTATGWRAIGAGPHVSAKVPDINDLMNHEYMSLSLFDRQTNQLICKIREVRPTGYSTGVSARGAVEVTINFIGLVIGDESTDNIEGSATPFS